MAKYTARVEVTVEFEAENSEQADAMVFIKLTDRLLATALEDEVFEMWLDVLEVTEED